MEYSPEQKKAAKALLLSLNNDLDHAIELLKNNERLEQVQYHPQSDEVVVEVSNVTKRYKVGKQKVEALNKANLTVFKGEFIAITGSSGSGKSTLLQLIGGLDKPTEGTITINHLDLNKLSDNKLSTFRNKTIGFVFQFFYLQPFLSLQTNIEVPAMFARTNKTSRQETSMRLAKIVGLSERLKHLPKELSGGQMQRAAIARALQNNPSIILADEPTGNLDRTNALAIFDIFRQIQQIQDTTVIVVTHDNELARKADRVVAMRDGVIV